MKALSAEASYVLARVKRYGLDTWQPGAVVISPLSDTVFIAAHAEVIQALLDSGHLVAGQAGSVGIGLAGDHQLSEIPGALGETRITIGGRRLQVITEGWILEEAAHEARQQISDGLGRLAAHDPAAFDSLYRSLLAGMENEALSVIVAAATSGSSKPARAALSNRVGVRAYGG